MLVCKYLKKKTEKRICQKLNLLTKFYNKLSNSNPCNHQPKINLAKIKNLFSKDTTPNLLGKLRKKKPLILRKLPAKMI